MSRRALRADEQRTLALLGLPTAALALAITVVTTYLPVVARPYLGSATVVEREGLFGSTQGYAAMWLVCSGTVLQSLLPTRALRRMVGDG